MFSTETTHTGGYCNTLLVTHRCACYCYTKLFIIIHGRRNTLLGAPLKGVQNGVRPAQHAAQQQVRLALLLLLRCVLCSVCGSLVPKASTPLPHTHGLNPSSPRSNPEIPHPRAPPPTLHTQAHSTALHAVADVRNRVSVPVRDSPNDPAPIIAVRGSPTGRYLLVVFRWVLVAGGVLQ